MKRHTHHLEITLAVLLVLSSPVFAWGPDGHRIASNLSEAYLTSDARVAVTEILGSQTIASASIWADQMRSNPSPWWQQTAGAYHYVTVPEGTTYVQSGPPEKGDALTALAQFEQVLRDPSAPLVQKQLALRFSIHIVQDLHQPLHVGKGDDRGGTRYQVRFLDETTNLHKVWDTSLIRALERSDAEWQRSLREGMTPAQVQRWWQADPQVWVGESAALRNQIYPATRTIGSTYLTQHQANLEQSLRRAAVRTAAYLEYLFR